MEFVPTIESMNVADLPRSNEDLSRFEDPINDVTDVLVRTTVGGHIISTI
jgi:hypothetical protein